MDDNTVKYLRALADKLMKVPASYGIDQGDVDRLLSIADGDDLGSDEDEIEALRTEARGLFTKFKQAEDADTIDVVTRDHLIDTLDALLDAVVTISEAQGHGKASAEDVLSMAKEEAGRIGSGAHSIKPVLNDEQNIEWRL